MFYIEFLWVSIKFLSNSRMSRDNVSPYLKNTLPADKVSFKVLSM